jgi:hypothetical protein
MEIKLDNQTITLQKLPLKKYAELLSALKKIPEQFEKFTETSNEEIVKVLPSLIASSIDEFVTVLTIATSLTKEQIEELAMDEIVKLIIGVIEVNRYSEVYANLKKVIAPAQAVRAS